jgi:hypothetical protein
MDKRPHRCRRGHWLLPGHMLVGSMPCSCGRHTTWECECSDVTYEPVLTESCTLFKRRRAVRSRRQHWRFAEVIALYRLRQLATLQSTVRLLDVVKLSVEVC